MLESMVEDTVIVQFSSKQKTIYMFYYLIWKYSDKHLS